MKNNKGFTLIEISVVLLVIALITSMAVKSGIAVVDTAKQNATIKKMAAIDKALLAFRTKNDRLPSPAGLNFVLGNTYYGAECSSAACIAATPTINITSSIAEGALPTVTLGLPNDFMYDAWGNRIRYVVDINSTKTNAFTNTQMNAKFGSITIQYDNNNTDGNGDKRTTTAIYALISHGKNGHGGYTTNGKMFNANSSDASELINCHCTNAGVASTYSTIYVQQEATKTFDDIVTYKERSALRIRSDKGGTIIPYIYASDTTRVQRFDIQGNFVDRALGTSIRGIANDINGNIWFVDANNIKKFSATTGTITTLTLTGYTLNTPSGIAIDKSQFLWIADKNNNRLIKSDLNGNLVNSFTAVGGGSSLTLPFSVAIDSKSNVFVYDSNKKIHEFDINGHWIASFDGTNGGTAFNSAISYIAIDSADNIWVSDSTASNKIQEFTNAGVFIKSLANGNITCTGSSNNNSNSFTPYGIYISPAGDVWVEDGTGLGLLKLNLSATNSGACISYGTTTDGAGKLAIPQGLFISSR